MVKNQAELTVPINTDIKLLMTAPVNDVLHSFYVPAFRAKEDILPGQITKLWFNADKKENMIFNVQNIVVQDTHICDQYVNVVSQEEFNEFLNPAKKEAFKKAVDLLIRLWMYRLS